jgi:hypothetical protein
MSLSHHSLTITIKLNIGPYFRPRPTKYTVHTVAHAPLPSARANTNQPMGDQPCSPLCIDYHRNSFRFHQIKTREGEMWGRWMVVGRWVGKGSHLDIRLASKGFDVVHFHTSLVELLQRGRDTHMHQIKTSHLITNITILTTVFWNNKICVLVLLTP